MAEYKTKFEAWVQRTEDIRSLRKEFGGKSDAQMEKLEDTYVAKTKRFWESVGYERQRHDLVERSLMDDLKAQPDPCARLKLFKAFKSVSQQTKKMGLDNYLRIDPHDFDILEKFMVEGLASGCREPL